MSYHLQKQTYGADYDYNDVAAGDRGGRHDDVLFTDPDTGWIVNVRGEIYKTTDGRVNRFRMLNDTLGYAVGRRVYKYTR